MKDGDPSGGSNEIDSGIDLPPPFPTSTSRLKSATGSPLPTSKGPNSQDVPATLSLHLFPPQLCSGTHPVLPASPKPLLRFPKGIRPFHISVPLPGLFPPPGKPSPHPQPRQKPQDRETTDPRALGSRSASATCQLAGPEENQCVRLSLIVPPVRWEERKKSTS